jgi:hypothetical protein
MNSPASAASPYHDSKALRQCNAAQVQHPHGTELVWGLCYTESEVRYGRK